MGSEVDVDPAGIANIGLSCIKRLLSDGLHGKEEDESVSGNEDKKWRIREKSNKKICPHPQRTLGITGRMQNPTVVLQWVQI